MSAFMPSCSIDGCKKPAVARGWCRKHYGRWHRTGSPITLTKRQYGGGGPNDSGYWRIQVDGESVREHVHVAEKALGKPLPVAAVVHHVDGNRQRNVNSNLVICQNAAYHNLIHQRARALKESGNASFQKCWMCKRYDDPATMRVDRGRFYHLCCRKTYDASRYAQKGATDVVCV